MVMSKGDGVMLTNVELENGESNLLTNVELDDGESNQLQQQQLRPIVRMPTYRVQFVWLILLLIWTFYLFGLLSLWIDKDTLNMIDEISPSAKVLRFYTISNSCIDIRDEVWR